MLLAINVAVAQWFSQEMQPISCADGHPELQVSGAIHSQVLCAIRSDIWFPGWLLSILIHASLYDL